MCILSHYTQAWPICVCMQLETRGKAGHKLRESPVGWSKRCPQRISSISSARGRIYVALVKAGFRNFKYVLSHLQVKMSCCFTSVCPFVRCCVEGRSPWYDLRGWLGVKQQLSICLSMCRRQNVPKICTLFCLVPIAIAFILTSCVFWFEQCAVRMWQTSLHCEKKPYYKLIKRPLGDVSSVQLLAKLTFDQRDKTIGDAFSTRSRNLPSDFFLILSERVTNVSVPF